MHNSYRQKEVSAEAKHLLQEAKQHFHASCHCQVIASSKISALPSAATAAAIVATLLACRGVHIARGIPTEVVALGEIVMAGVDVVGVCSSYCCIAEGCHWCGRALQRNANAVKHFEAGAEQGSLQRPSTRSGRKRRQT